MTSKDDGWYRKRGYLHFDHPIGYKKARKIVANPKAVAKHSFWPLIHYEITTPKITKNSAGDVVRKEKTRPIAYASHLDSHIYAYYAQILAELYENRLAALGIGEYVSAFRSLGKSNIEFARDAFKSISEFGPCAVVGVDITGFFDNLDHAILKMQWSSVLGEPQLPHDHFAVFKSLTRFALVSRESLYDQLGISKHNPKNGRDRICKPEEFHSLVRKAGLISSNKGSKGIPQGTPISALLSNIYMIEFDKRMAEVVSEWGGRYFRYCDDMLFIVPQEFEKTVGGMVTTEIKALKLAINPKKTEIRLFSKNAEGGLHSNQPIQYLGFLFDGQQILLRSAALSRYSDRMKRGVKLARRTSYKRNTARIRRGLHPKPLYKQKLYERYSHLGSRNFVRYGLRAADIMESKAIRRQLKPLWKNLQKEIYK